MHLFISWDDFWITFRLSILISLIGALIGHYSKNGVIQFPLFVIPYERSEWLNRCLQTQGRWEGLRKGLTHLLLTPVDLLLFILGFRSDPYGSQRVYLELGLLGDILIGVGTGILAKTTVEMAGSTNPYAEVSAAFIAGFAGLSYIRERQRKDLGMNRPLDPSIMAQAVVDNDTGSTEGNNKKTDEI